MKIKYIGDTSINTENKLNKYFYKKPMIMIRKFMDKSKEIMSKIKFLATRIELLIV